MISALSEAVRSWSGAKVIALLATVAFAVGIGSTTAIYTVVRAVLLAPLPYGGGDRFVAIYGARFSEPKQFSSQRPANCSTSARSPSRRRSPATSAPSSRTASGDASAASARSSGVRSRSAAGR